MKTIKWIPLFLLLFLAVVYAQEARTEQNAGSPEKSKNVKAIKGPEENIIRVSEGIASPNSRTKAVTVQKIRQENPQRAAEGKSDNVREKVLPKEGKVPESQIPKNVLMKKRGEKSSRENKPL